MLHQKFASTGMEVLKELHTGFFAKKCVRIFSPRYIRGKGGNYGHLNFGSKGFLYISKRSHPGVL